MALVIHEPVAVALLPAYGRRRRRYQSFDALTRSKGVGGQQGGTGPWQLVGRGVIHRDWARAVPHLPLRYPNRCR